VIAEFAVDGEAQTQAISFGAGGLIVNADDWGRHAATTDRIRECFEAKALSSASAMVFMEDSERAAGIAREHKFDCGLHLNLTTPFSASGCSSKLAERQRRITQYLRRNRFAQICFHPGLTSAFQYVVAAQIDEYRRIYGAEPGRIDGHHHMHLCANVLYGGLIPEGAIARRNFSFWPGEKSWGNRLYRRVQDRRLGAKNRLTDFFFSLPPLKPASRLQKIFSLSREFVVELETHPVNPEEYRFLTGGEFFRQMGDVPVASGYIVDKAVAQRMQKS
jgi:predicted glycoside hydrolase/deacetylase ChbG (UPF0249 family)